MPRVPREWKIALREAGFECNQGTKHEKWVHPDGRRVTLQRGNIKHRTIHNQAADLRRIGVLPPKQKQTKSPEPQESQMSAEALEVCNRFREFIRDNYGSVAKAAEATDLSQNKILGWFQPHRAEQRKNINDTRCKRSLTALATGFGLRLEWLLEGKGEPFQNNGSGTHPTEPTEEAPPQPQPEDLLQEALVHMAEAREMTAKAQHHQAEAQRLLASLADCSLQRPKTLSDLLMEAASEMGEDNRLLSALLVEAAATTEKQGQ